MISPRKLSRSRRIGPLLVDAGLLEPGPLEEAARVAKDSSQPIGRVLLMLGYVSDDNLKQALYAQSLVGQGLLAYENAVRAVRVAAVRGMPLDDALKEMGLDPISAPLQNSLAELLLESNWITKPLFDEAVKLMFEGEGLVGRYLVFKGALTNALLGNVLDLLVMLRDGLITKAQAIQVLGDMRNKRMSFQEALDVSKIYVAPTKKTRLGDILTLSGVLTDSESLDAVELALMENQMLGQILTQAGMVSEPSLQTALALQGLVSRGLLDRGQASEVLRVVQTRKVSMQEAIDELKVFRAEPQQISRSLTLLKNSGVVRQDDIAQARAKHPEMDEVRALLAVGFIEKELYDAVGECVKYLESGEFRLEQAIILLQWCQRSRCTLAEAMSELSVTHDGKEESEAESEEIAPKKFNNPLAEFVPQLGGSEFKQLLGTAVFFAILGYAGLAYLPVKWHAYALWTLVVLLAITLMALARSWAKSKEEQDQALDMRIEGVRAARKRSGTFKKFE